MAVNNWDANLYDNKHSFVSKYGNSLIELLAPKKGEKILDLGSGTRDLANALTKYGAEVVGVDKSENMVKQAIKKYPHISFKVQDVTALDYDGEFDAVFSNANPSLGKSAYPSIKGDLSQFKKRREICS